MQRRFAAVLFAALASAPVIHGQTAAPKPADPLAPVRAHLPAPVLGPSHTQAVPLSDVAPQTNRPIPYYTPPFVPPGIPRHPVSRERAEALVPADSSEGIVNLVVARVLALQQGMDFLK